MVSNRCFDLRGMKGGGWPAGGGSELLGASICGGEVWVPLRPPPPLPPRPLRLPHAHSTHTPGPDRKLYLPSGLLDPSDVPAYLNGTLAGE